MTTANVAELKSHLSRYLDLVAHGESVQICKRNVAVALIVPLAAKKKNKTQLDCGKGVVVVHGDLTEPVMDPSDWNMLGGEL